MNQILGPLLFVSLALTLTLTVANGGSDGASIFWWIITGMLLVFLLPNILMGPTCVCSLKTAVQTEELNAAANDFAGRAGFMERVQPLIVAAQGKTPAGGNCRAPDPTGANRRSVGSGHRRGIHGGRCYQNAF